MIHTAHQLKWSAGLKLAIMGSLFAASAFASARTGKPHRMRSGETEALESLRGTIKGKVVWSTSRTSGTHDIFIMNGDGTDKKPLTNSDRVDWFARFSPDGSKVAFCRSKRSWESETYAKDQRRWDIWIVNSDGTDEKKLIDKAVWPTWTSDGRILFARGTSAHLFDPSTGNESQLIDGEIAFRRGAVLQQPQMSPNGKYVAITLRGSMRETGIWDIGNGTWCKVGAGCQINWFPSGTRMIRMNENTGRGGTEVFAFDVKDGQPIDARPAYRDLKFMDLPGRRSHEYFPVISGDGKWMVWCATDRGHDHDLYDYEVYVWKIGTPTEDAVRLTFHSGNDRWPDIHVGLRPREQKVVSGE